MTEGNDDGNYLVRVRAQVMMRDDSTGGWVPMGGGGLSNVSVRKRITHPDLDDSKHEYLIFGKKISDQTVVLSCTIKKDFEYYKVMPTFHHWKTGDMKFGLTFQTAADARSFDSGVRRAFDDLVEGLNDVLSYRRDLDVEKVFVTVHLPPVEREGSRSSSSGSAVTSSSPPNTTTPYNTTNNTTTTTTSTTTTTTTTHDYLHHITFLPRPKPPLPPSIKPPPDKPIELEYDLKHHDNPLDHHHHHHHHHHLPSDHHDKGDVTSSYVQFDKENPRHDYSYPVVEGIKKDTSGGSLKKPQSLEVGRGGTPSQHMAPAMMMMAPHTKPRGDKGGGRGKRTVKARCKHCQGMFTYDSNSRGSCEFAPDCVRSAIDTLTCIACAQCMLYHCMSDAEGDFAHHPCECGGPGGAADESCGRRWLGLTLLSLLVPCLWCYLPLRACHQCAVACGLCGGRHEAAS